MKKYSLDKEDKQLVEMAKETIKKNARDDNKVATSVGCALLSKSGKIYTGVNIRIKSCAPVSICAEMGAIAQMVNNGEKEIWTIVSYHEKGFIDPPCGACRHIISQFGDPQVIVTRNKKIRLNELYPGI